MEPWNPRPSLGRGQPCTARGPPALQCFPAPVPNGESPVPCSTYDRGRGREQSHQETGVSSGPRRQEEGDRHSRVPSAEGGARGCQGSGTGKPPAQSLGAPARCSVFLAFSPVKEKQCVGGGQRGCGRGVKVTGAVGDRLYTRAQEPERASVGALEAWVRFTGC